MCAGAEQGRRRMQASKLRNEQLASRATAHRPQKGCRKRGEVSRTMSLTKIDL